ncbi:MULTISPECIES: hypothetical protein [Bacillus cereus group]|uniref:hypothetical protein n=1 Tax=Bacillus cereus group TaxID=86661 RepID=UPI001298C11C|nr:MULTISPECIES: hypothetical protein [Bacillus cereus group]MEB9467849.1 hypothetical protein [Bacillus cereus]MRA82454.1 hypothetical protein [Bacillus thuringiensis]
MTFIKKLFGYCDGCKRLFTSTVTIDMEYRNGTEETVCACEECESFYLNMMSHWE